MKNALLGTTILLALISTMPTGLAATQTPFSAKLTFNLSVCVDDQGMPKNPCQYWKYAYVTQETSGKTVHILGWTGTWTLEGTINGTGEITRKYSHVSWASWTGAPLGSQSENFQAWGTINDYMMYVFAWVVHGTVINGGFEMRGHGTYIYGSIKGSVDYNTGVAPLEGFIQPA